MVSGLRGRTGRRDLCSLASSYSSVNDPCERMTQLGEELLVLKLLEGKFSSKSDTQPIEPHWPGSKVNVKKMGGAGRVARERSMGRGGEKTYVILSTII